MKVANRVFTGPTEIEDENGTSPEGVRAGGSRALGIFSSSRAGDSSGGPINGSDFKIGFFLDLWLYRVCKTEGHIYHPMRPQHCSIPTQIR